MHDVEQLRMAILEAVPYLPPVFDPVIVAERIEVSPGYIALVRKALNSLEADGHIFRVASVRKVKGRRPARWSVIPCTASEGEIEDAVTDVLGRLPARFTVWDLLKIAGMPHRLAKDIAAVLERLAARQIVVRIPGRKIGRPGVTNVLWSADPAVIASEVQLRQNIDRQRTQVLAETREVFARLDDSFWELDPT